jgi:hypothetical protein
MPSILEVDTIKNKTGTQNTVLSTDGSGNNTISVANIKANDGTAGISLADSTGRLTVTETNPSITLGSNATLPLTDITAQMVDSTSYMAVSYKMIFQMDKIVFISFHYVESSNSVNGETKLIGTLNSGYRPSSDTVLPSVAYHASSVDTVKFIKIIASSGRIEMTNIYSPNAQHYGTVNGWFKLP